MEASLRATDGARWRDAVDPAVEDRLAAAVDELALLPVLDATVLRVLAAVDDPGTTNAELVAIIEGDPAFAAGVIRSANATGARPIPAQTIREAVMLVGRRTLHHLALETAACRFLALAPGAESVRADLRSDAIAAGAAALTIAQDAGLDLAVPYLAALLHDVGKLVLPLAADPGECAVIAAEHPHGAARVRAERERLGVDHAVAGAMLAERWNLPEGVPEAIALHHGGPGGLAVPDREAAVMQIAARIPHLAHLPNRAAPGDEPDRKLLERALAMCRTGPALLEVLTSHALPAPARAVTQPAMAARRAA